MTTPVDRRRDLPACHFQGPAARDSREALNRIGLDHVCGGLVVLLTSIESE